MLTGKTATVAAEVMAGWKKAIEENKVYGFGFSKLLYFGASPGRHEDSDFSLAGVFDNNLAIDGQTLLGFKIMNPKEISRLDGKIVVFSGQYESIMRQLMQFGLKPGYDFIEARNFWPLYEFFVRGKLYVNRNISLIALEHCTLKCKDCILFMPYYKERETLAPEEAAAQMEMLFNKADYVKNIQLTGGEPLIHPRLSEMIDLIGRNYRNRIQYFSLPTSGTVLPDQKTLNSLKKYDLRVTVSDYRQAGLPNYAKTFEPLLELLSKNEIQYSVSPMTWSEYSISPDAAPVLQNASEEELWEHFSDCSMQVANITGGRFYFCVSGAVLNRKFRNDFGSDGLDLNDCSKLDLLMCSLGYNERGYPSYCRGCAGGGLTQRTVQKAAQLG